MGAQRPVTIESPRGISWRVSACIAACLGLVLASCSLPFAPPAPTAAPSLTPPPTPTRTVSPTPSPTLAPLPTATLTLVPTTTPVPLPPGEALPANLAGLIPESAPFLAPLAEWQLDTVRDLAWLDFGDTLAVANLHSVVLYETRTRNVRKQIETGKDQVGIAYSPDGAWLATGHTYGSEVEGFASNLMLWLSPNYPRTAIYGDQRPLTDLAFTPDGKLLAVAYTGPGTGSGAVDLLNIFTWSITGTLQTGAVTEMAIAPDGKTMATSPDRYALNIWSLETGALLEKIPTSFSGAINSLAFSPDGSKLAAGLYDGTIHIWETAKYAQLKSMQADGVVESLAFGRDNRLLASGQSYNGGTLQLWSVESGQLLAAYSAHAHAVEQLAFSPSGMLLVSASYDGTVRLWGVRQ